MGTWGVELSRRILYWTVAKGLPAVLFAILGLGLPRIATAATYFVDFPNGSDSASGTDKSSPWKHAPGMSGCAGACGNTNLNAGDSVVFKGGIVWNQSSFPFNINFSGKSGSRITYTVDKSWFSGGSWTQPVFDGGFNQISGGSLVVFGATTQWVTLDNIEIRNITVNNGGGHGLDNSLIQFQFGAINITVQNCLVHGVRVTNTGSGADQQFGAIYGLGPMTNTVVDHCTVFNDQGTANTIAGLIFNIDTVTNSVIHDGIQGVFGARLVHGNVIYNILSPSDPSSHPNALQVSDANAQVYNNIVHDVQFGTCIYAVPSGASGNVLIYNNVVWNTEVDPVTLEPESISGGGMNASVFNNTLNGAGGSAIRTVPRGTRWATVTVQNNHYISDAGSAENFPSGSFGNLVDSKNILTTQSEAQSQGYTIANQFAPTQASGATVGSGLSLASLNITTLNFDIKGVARPSANWDAGAYQLNLSGSTRPAPPTNLSAIVQ